MAGHPEGEIDSMDVLTRLQNGQTQLKTYIFMMDDGSELTVAQSLAQVFGQQEASKMNPRIKFLNGAEKAMDRNRRILDYVNELTDGTLLL